MRDWAHSRRLGTPADEAGSVVLRQPPASMLANLCRIDVRDHALGLVTRQLDGRVTEHPPGGWLGPRTPSLREGRRSRSRAWRKTVIDIWKRAPPQGHNGLMNCGEMLAQPGLVP